MKFADLRALRDAAPASIMGHSFPNYNAFLEVSDADFVVDQRCVSFYEAAREAIPELLDQVEQLMEQLAIKQSCHKDMQAIMDINNQLLAQIQGDEGGGP